MYRKKDVEKGIYKDRRGHKPMWTGYSPKDMGVKNMLSNNTITYNNFEKEVVGFRELRNNLSNFIERSINNYEEIISGNVKRGNENTVSIISTRMFEDILSAFKFNPQISYDKATGQYEAILQEINLYGCGDTEEDAKNMLFDLVVDSAVDYFENMELYIRIPELKEKLPYYLRIRHCNNSTEIREALGLL